MATTLIDIHNNIKDQVIPSWRKFCETDEAKRERLDPNDPIYLTNSDSVYKRNALWANKLITLYNELNIDVEDRWELWKFFEVTPSGVVNWVKDQISTLKKIKKIHKKQEKLGLEATNASDLFKSRRDLSIYQVEKDLNSLETLLKKYKRKLKNI